VGGPALRTLLRPGLGPHGAPCPGTVVAAVLGWVVATG
jgi:hypothetical protein